jgi:drug/metabolite transporter (DMT)-like permease
MLRPLRPLHQMTDLQSRSSAVVPALFVLLWSTGFIGARLGLPHAEPLTFLSMRYALVLVLLCAFVLATASRWPRGWRAYVHIAVSGVLIHGVYLGGVFIALHRGLPAGLTALIVGLQPLLTAIAAGWLLGPRVSPRQWSGLVLGLFGVAMVVTSEAGVGELSALAMVPALVAAVAALLGITAGTLYQKVFCPRFDLATGAIIQFVPTFLLTAAVAFHTETMQIAWTGQFTFALLWLVLVLSLGAISLLNLLIRRGTAVDVASLFYLVPPSTALLAWLVFGETLNAVAVVGMIAAVAGVFQARRSTS